MMPETGRSAIARLWTGRWFSSFLAPLFVVALSRRPLLAHLFSLFLSLSQKTTSPPPPLRTSAPTSTTTARTSWETSATAPTSRA
jgi:hypothetical protein